MMSLLHILFPAAAVLPVVVNGIAIRLDHKNGDALGMSLVLLTVWGIQRFLWPVIGDPEAQGLNPMFDISAGLAALGCFIAHRRPWMIVLASLYGVQLLLAAAFWWGWEVFDHAISLRHYKVANNVVWLLEVVTLTVVGGAVVVRRHLDGLRDHLHRGPGVGAPT